jgi:FtsP/CotA-like multicopper oxidase with cupredoxin domain
VEDINNDTDKNASLPSRRSVLKLGASGLGAAGLAALGAGSIATPAVNAQTPGSGQGQQPPKPPSPEAIVTLTGRVVEDWTEPWIWRPSEWPDQPLVLNVVSNPSPPRAISPGNRFAPLYSFNGSSPGPTIRVRGDERLRVIVRNHLGPNLGRVPKGPCPDPFEQRPEVMGKAFCAMATAEGMDCKAPALTTRIVFEHFHQLLDLTPATMIDTACLSGPVNLPHASHTTNLHTHGLHTQPGLNANGTFGDNTHSRILPRADGEMRRNAKDARCRTLDANERVGEGHYEHPLAVPRTAGGGRAGNPHPPGTHWYHPHAHGATHDQVSSGLAGFLIVEGDVDDAINRAMTGEPRPDPTKRTGRYDYRERLMMLQRVEVFSTDVDQSRRPQIRIAPPVAVNGAFTPTVMVMRPGAVERWRVLNASVDGRGFKHFMVLEGQFVFHDRQLWRVLPPATEGAAVRFEPATRQDVAKATQRLYQLAFDGITLVEVVDGRARYTIKDLATQNAGTENPLDRPLATGEPAARAMLDNIEACSRDADSLRRTINRPNQVFLSNANRADVLFKAPLDSAGKVFTVFGQEFPLGTDNFEQRMQIGAARSGTGFTAANPAPIDVVMGYIKISGSPVEGGDFDVMSLRQVLPPVPIDLQPVQDDELRVQAAEATRRKVPAGSFRTRVISYSGYGPTDFPLIAPPADFVEKNPTLKGLVWDEIDGAKVLLPPFSRTMAVNSEFDLAVNPDPPAAQKFAHHDHTHPKALVNTAEEWVLYNCSIGLWSHTDAKRFPQPGQYALHYRAYPMTKAEGRARHRKDPEFQITTKGADHPFHIHINPCWVTRIEVPDEQGRLHNILDAPCWMDTVSIPRGGRVVFRSRFADYTGMWVNHCHILMHEDHGMMQAVSSVARAEDANYNPRTRVASHALSADEVSAIYPAPSLELMYRQSLMFVDASPDVGQVYPGFGLTVPKVDVTS